MPCGCIAANADAPISVKKEGSHVLSGGLGFLIGALVGFLSGMTGLGGSFLLIPLLIAVPDFFRLEGLTAHEVSAIAALYVFSATSAGLFIHAGRGFASRKLILVTGGAAFLAGLTGGFVSSQVPEILLLRGFFFLVVAGLLLLILPGRQDEGLTVPEAAVPFTGAAVTGTAIGFVGGVTGISGGFLFIPTLHRLLGLPLRMVVGSSLGIVLLSATAAGIGKAITGQIPWKFALPVALGGATAAPIGAYLSPRISGRWIRRIIAIMVAVAAFEIGLRAWMH